MKNDAIKDLFSDFGMFGDVPFTANPAQEEQQNSEIPYNHYSLDNDIEVIEFALAGYKKSDIKVKVSDSVIVINVQKATKDATVKFHHHGIKQKSFETKYALTHKVVTDKIKVTFKDGLLKITCPIKTVEQELEIN